MQPDSMQAGEAERRAPAQGRPLARGQGGNFLASGAPAQRGDTRMRVHCTAAWGFGSVGSSGSEGPQEPRTETRAAAGDARVNAVHAQHIPLAAKQLMRRAAHQRPKCEAQRASEPQKVFACVWASAPTSRAFSSSCAWPSGVHTRCSRSSMPGVPRTCVPKASTSTTRPCAHTHTHTHLAA